MASESKVDIWMPLSIGDYLADTSHLNTTQHGAYLLMLMHYWRKGPLPNDSATLANITKLSTDAWSMNQAVLMQFYFVGEDGMLHQKRADKERAEATQKRAKSHGKAKAAAEARWKIAPSISQSNAPEMHEECPLPLPSPNTEEQKQKPSRDKRETKTAIADRRHAEFKEAIRVYWVSKNRDLELPWDGAEGKQLGMFLRAAPHITVDQFTGFLRNRYLSEINHGDRPSRWITGITSYAAGPMDKYGKTMEVRNGNNGKTGPDGANKPSAARERTDRGKAAIAGYLAGRGIGGAGRADGADDRSLPEPGQRAGGDGLHGGHGAAGSEALFGESEGCSGGATHPPGPEILPPSGRGSSGD